MEECHFNVYHTVFPLDSFVIIKELNPRRRVYVEIPKPSRVEQKCSHNAEGFDVILATPETLRV
jgi:hypothetical protein